MRSRQKQHQREDTETFKAVMDYKADVLLAFVTDKHCFKSQKHFWNDTQVVLLN